jgi:hypothetical protein
MKKDALIQAYRAADDADALLMSCLAHALKESRAFYIYWRDAFARANDETR